MEPWLKEAYTVQ